MLTVTPAGLYCAAGGFHIDPWRAVERAVITHAHSDHARRGCQAYLCARDGVEVLRVRLGTRASVSGLAYGEPVRLQEVQVSFHPAGHVLGSAQIRIEHRGEIWVVSGDYKTHPDPTCAGFEPVRCHTFVTESTFGLPVYRWPEPRQVQAELQAWWQTNQQQGRTSLVFAYSLGKAQRVLASLDASAGPLLAHPAVMQMLPAYAAASVRLPEVQAATSERLRANLGRALVLAPPAGAAWPGDDTLAEAATAAVSGWMLLRRSRLRGGIERGFVLSDHADWPGLVEAIRATGAGRILVTHGQTAPLVRWLAEQGWQSEAWPARLPTP